MRAIALPFVVTSVLISSAIAAPLGSSITYQGQMVDAGTPASGPHDFEFALYTLADGGTAVDSVIVDDLVVDAGLINATLDFTQVPFDGQALWIEVRVRPGASTGSYTTLAPRQAMNAAPYALYALDGNPGPQGPIGAVGTTGPAGPTGPAGEQGPAGVVTLPYSASDASQLSFSITNSNAEFGVAVYGLVAKGTGVVGQVSGRGTGVVGTSGLGGTGVFGGTTQTTSPALQAAGVRGTNDNGPGVWGSSETLAGVYGEATSGGYGVWGNGVGGSTGVLGNADATNVPGVSGVNSAGPGVWGRSTVNSGTIGQSTSGYGVYGTTTGSNVAGVYGAAVGSNGVNGISTNAWGVYGRSTTNVGILGDSEAADSAGMVGRGWIGVQGVASGSADSQGVRGSNGGSNTLGYAGYFNGRVTVFGNMGVVGTLSKSAGAFKIDHPLDPANKYLSHSFVESPDMKNIYDGIDTLDGSGQVTVKLPDWFGALNGSVEQDSFRYQLTCLGGHAPVYIAEEIRDNRFRIAGGMPGQRVSWQVTGIRHDAYAEHHRIPVEEDKPAHEAGKYLSPEAHGLAPGMGIVLREVEVPSRIHAPGNMLPTSTGGVP